MSLATAKVNPGSRRHLIETLQLINGASVPSENLANRISRLGQISRLDIVWDVVVKSNAQTGNSSPLWAEPSGSVLEDIRVKVNRETVYQVEGRWAVLNAALTHRYSPPIFPLPVIPAGQTRRIRGILPIPFNLERTLRLSDGGWLGGELAELIVEIETDALAPYGGDTNLEFVSGQVRIYALEERRAYPVLPYAFRVYQLNRSVSAGHVGLTPGFMGRAASFYLTALSEDGSTLPGPFDEISIRAGGEPLVEGLVSDLTLIARSEVADDPALYAYTQTGFPWVNAPDALYRTALASGTLTSYGSFISVMREQASRVPYAPITIDLDIDNPDARTLIVVSSGVIPPLDDAPRLSDANDNLGISPRPKFELAKPEPESPFSPRNPFGTAR
jgi:hypothetical protein